MYPHLEKGCKKAQGIKALGQTFQYGRGNRTDCCFLNFSAALTLIQKTTPA